MRVSNQSEFGNYGGLGQASYYPYNPIASAPWSQTYPGVVDQNGNVIETPAQEYAATVGLLPGSPVNGRSPHDAEQLFATPLTFNKIGYTWNINPTTFLNLNWANFYNQTTQHFNTAAEYQMTEEQVGGQRVFGEMDLTHQFGANHTTTLAVRYQDDLPRWNNQSPWFASDTLGYTGAAVNQGSLANGGAAYLPDISDWYLPPNTTAPVSAANPCPNYPGSSTAGSCYIYSYMMAHGLWNGIGSLPRIPNARTRLPPCNLPRVGHRSSRSVDCQFASAPGLRSSSRRRQFGLGTEPLQLHVGSALESVGRGSVDETRE